MAGEVSALIKEFREFITKGNVMDLAVGIIIGAAFTAIVNSFVKDLLTPLLGIFGKANFENLFVVLKADPSSPGPFTTVAEAQAGHAVVLTYGNFLNAVLNFLIVGFVLFLMVKSANRFKRKEEIAEAADPVPTAEEKLLTEIRDLLKAK
jgi:large conductance mechanosensitive channel